MSAVTPGEHLAEGLGRKKGEGIRGYCVQLSLNHPAASNQTYVHRREQVHLLGQSINYRLKINHKQEQDY